MGDRRHAYRILVGKHKEMRTLGRPRRRWKNNISIDLQKVGFGMAWIYLAQDRNMWRALVNFGSCKSGNEPSGSVKCGEFID
jgi:hypothetical protein